MRTFPVTFRNFATCDHVRLEFCFLLLGVADTIFDPPAFQRWWLLRSPRRPPRCCLCFFQLVVCTLFCIMTSTLRCSVGDPTFPLSDRASNSIAYGSWPGRLSISIYILHGQRNDLVRGAHHLASPYVQASPSSKHASLLPCDILSAYLPTFYSPFYMDFRVSLAATKEASRHCQ